MNALIQLHRDAMELADRAAAKKREGDHEAALELTREAFKREREAALTTENQVEFEPTRSVLHRSAASLALECDEVREAERLIAAALAGNLQRKSRKNCATCWKTSTFGVISRYVEWNSILMSFNYHCPGMP